MRKKGKRGRYQGFLKFAFKYFPFCQYCGNPLVFENDFKRTLPEHTASTDHIIPISRGGSVDDWNNLVISCKKCNESWSNKLNHPIRFGPRLSWDVIRQIENQRRNKRKSKED